MSKTNSLNETANKLKKAISQEKNHTEALDLVHKIIEAKIGDAGRLDHIRTALENGSTLYESDKQYFEEKSEQLQELVDNQRKVELTLQALNKLHESELRYSERLNAIKKAFQEGKQVTESEINFLNTKYEKFQHEIDCHKRVDWTIDVIKRLHGAEIGNYERLEAIKAALEDGRNVDQSEIGYLKEKYKILKQINAGEKIQWTIDTINKLQQAEIGNYERLEKIKIALKQERNIIPEEISYVKEKYEQLLVIKKSKNASDKSNIEDIIENITLNELTTKTSELEKNAN